MPNWTESDMAIAMAGIRDESMTYTYVRKTYGIPRATIAGRLNGRLERRAAHVSQRRLTKEQEEELAEWIMDLDSRHQPPSQPRCRLMALEIQRASGSDAGLGREWLYQFFNKYPRCGSLLGDPHESVRVNNATEENVRAWFDMFSSFRDKFRVLDANIHNMDEHGLCIGKINPRKVVGAAFDAWGKLRKRTKCRNSQTREWVSIVECISGGGTSVSPLIIFEGLNTPDEPPPYKYKATPTAWTNDEVALAWLNEIFIPETRPRGAQPSNFESAFKKAGLIPFDPQSVIDRPAVVKNPPLLPPSELDGLQPRIYDPKTLKKDLYELNKENNASIDEKLDMATWIAEKAIQALGHKTVELAKQELKYKTLEFKHIALQEKKGRKKVPPKRGRELVDAGDIVAKQKEWKRDNETPPPSRSVRSRMKK
ncbi:hypothetical protein D6D08_10539 [Aureobasidium pullulans]|nr:hypothetical protein D6D08_10539 [Aureobasidium pullulans]